MNLKRILHTLGIYHFRLLLLTWAIDLVVWLMDRINGINIRLVKVGNWLIKKSRKSILIDRKGLIRVLQQKDAIDKLYGKK